ncbi:MAG: hypothetical protein WC332_00510 [Clostridia bacterium]|jgi:hypothetical protein
MSTLSLSGIRTLIRSEINEATTTSLTDAELNSIINDAYKDTSVKGLCYESKIAKTNITSKIISLASDNIVKINYVEYDLGTSCLGMIQSNVPTIGHTPVDGSTPQYWFKWGDYLIVEPVPDVSTYDLNLYASCYPAAVLSGDTDTLVSLPIEFHECVYLYSVAFSCLKLKRWGDFVSFYNRYIESVQSKKMEYISKFPEVRQQQDIPRRTK